MIKFIVISELMRYICFRKLFYQNETNNKNDTAVNNSFKQYDEFICRQRRKKESEKQGFT